MQFWYQYLTLKAKRYMKHSDTSTFKEVFAKRKYLLLTLIIVIYIIPVEAKSKQDSIVLANGDIILGKIESLDKSVLTFSTDYSDDDFKIKWEEVREIYSNRLFIIALDNGNRFEGKITTHAPLQAVVTYMDSSSLRKHFKEIVYLDNINKKGGMWDAAFDLGYTYTKASNLQQLILNTGASYYSRQWMTHFKYNIISNRQEGIDPFMRMDGKIDFLRFIKKGWLSLASVDMLKNEEQNLKLRTTSKLGIGKFIKRTNQLYFVVALGGAWNKEHFMAASDRGKNSMEGFLSIELNFYNIGDLNLLTSATIYPSLSENGRVRSDYKLGIKYDLPLDFYLSISYKLNFDNKPTGMMDKYDYVLETTFGWEF